MNNNNDIKNVWNLFLLLLSTTKNINFLFFKKCKLNLLVLLLFVLWLFIRASINKEWFKLEELSSIGSHNRIHESPPPFNFCVYFFFNQIKSN